MNNHLVYNKFEKIENKLEKEIRENGSADASILFILIKKHK